MIKSTVFEFENFKLTLNSTYYRIVVTVKLEFEHVLFRSTCRLSHISYEGDF